MIGILGGTFDPIHNGHLYIAEHITQHISLNKMLFIPCHQSPHKLPPIANTHDRSVMVQLAIKTHPLFEFSDIELNRPAPSYMIDTLRLLKKKYPDESLNLIIGSDAYAHFTKWHDWQHILEYAQLTIVNRATDHLTSSDREMSQLIRFLDIPPCDISSTDIRARMARGDSIAGLVPKAVEDYILEKKLYLGAVKE